MNTPTPEDIRLAEELTECWWLNKEKAQAIIAAHTAPLRELAEIGRLAVEEEKLRCALKAKYVASGGKTDGCMGLYDDFYKASITHREAVCACLAKREEAQP